MKFMFNRYLINDSGLPKSHNTNFFLVHKFLRTQWVAKASRNLEDTALKHPQTDLSNRALIAYKLAQLVDSPIPDTKIISLSQIEFSPKFTGFINEMNKNLSKDGILLTKFKGICLTDFLKFHNITDIKNLTSLLHNFVFNLWIGNYDKKDSDYVVDQKGMAWSIDYNLSGPGAFPKSNLSLGENAWGYSIANTEHTGFCLGDTIRQYMVKNKTDLDFFAPEISKIKNLDKQKIIEVFSGITITDMSGKEINKKYVDFLNKRKNILDKTIKKWISMGYPRKYTSQEKKVNPPTVDWKKSVLEK